MRDGHVGFLLVWHSDIRFVLGMVLSMRRKSQKCTVDHLDRCVTLDPLGHLCNGQALVAQKWLDARMDQLTELRSLVQRCAFLASDCRFTAFVVDLSWAQLSATRSSGIVQTVGLGISKWRILPQS